MKQSFMKSYELIKSNLETLNIKFYCKIQLEINSFHQTPRSLDTFPRTLNILSLEEAW